MFFITMFHEQNSVPHKHNMYTHNSIEWETHAQADNNPRGLCAQIDSGYFSLKQHWIVVIRFWRIIGKMLRTLVFTVLYWNKSRDSVSGIGTGYGLHNRWVGFRIPVGPRNFSSPRHPDRLWGPHNLLFTVYLGLFPGSKAAGEWSWSGTSS
jgi:hypothetical protein